MSHSPSAQPGAHACPNCGTVLSGKFCQGCGQAAHLHVPSAREFLHEFISHYVALEGKLWKSMALLLFRPGRLTRDYIEGKRARYIEPLRLYLTFSILFFAIFKLTGNSFGEAAVPQPALQDKTTQQAPAGGVGNGKLGKLEQRAEAAARQAQASGKPAEQSLLIFDDGEKITVTQAAAAIHPLLGAKVGQFSALPESERKAALKRSFFSYTPYAIFALMPVFAALLKLLYAGSGRRYGEHLLFALHANAFAFLMLSLVLVLPDALPLLDGLLVIWLVFYLPTAMRRVYGGGRLSTAVRWLVLMLMHIVCTTLAVLAAASLAIMA